MRREISLRFLTKSFTFKLIQVSTTYFTKPDNRMNQKPNPDVESPENIKEKKLKVEEIDKKEVISELEADLCVFCYQDPPNIMIDKCGHGGVCKTCVIYYLKHNKVNCPFCKQPIHKLFLLEKDNGGTYYAKGEIKFKE